MLKWSLIYYFIIIFHIIAVNSLEITVNNEDELISNINSNKDNTLIINIKNININVSKKIEINKNIKKISIMGTSKNTSILNFDDITNGFIFNSFIQEITFNELTIYGHLEFNNVKNVILKNTILNGSINTNNECSNNEMIQMNSFTFNALVNPENTCIKLYGNVKIENSYFYGNPSCKDSILSYNGESLNDINISSSFFDGMYSNSCIDINDAHESNIMSSVFEKGAAYTNGGYIKHIIIFIYIE